jgi:hypothetical protein
MRGMRNAARGLGGPLARLHGLHQGASPGRLRWALPLRAETARAVGGGEVPELGRVRPLPGRRAKCFMMSTEED